jgi:hypothetical protein
MAGIPIVVERVADGWVKPVLGTRTAAGTAGERHGMS